MKLILGHAQATARKIIQEKSATLEANGARLLEKEVIDREEFLWLAKPEALPHTSEI